MNQSPVALADVNNTHWQLLEELADEIAAAAERESDELRFYAHLLDKLRQAVAAVGAAAWRVEPSGHTGLIVARQLPEADRAGHAELATDAARAGSRLTVPPGGSHGVYTNSSQHVIVLQPVASDRHPFAVIQLHLTSGEASKEFAAATRFLDAVVELAADFHRRQVVREFDSNAALFDDLLRVAERAHAGLDGRSTCYRLANDGRRWLGCDRLSVLWWSRGRARLGAISGVESPDRRAAQVQHLERLGGLCGQQSETICYDVDSQDLSPELRAALEAYVDESHAKRVLAIPLPFSTSTGENDAEAPIGGILLAEDFTPQQPMTRLQWRAQRLNKIASTALNNARTYEAIPFRHVFSSPLVRRLCSRRATALVVLLLGVVAAGWIPVEFTIAARGTLQPEVRQHVFAPEDAIVNKVCVRDGEHVTAGKDLILLRKSALDQEITRVATELQTAQQLYRVAKAKRFVAAGDSTQSPEEIAADEVLLADRVQSLLEQSKLLEVRKKSLRVMSPFSGTVMNWNSEHQLRTRPVKAGQQLMTIADPTGPWQLELEISDRDIRHVLEAKDKQARPLHVVFHLATEPSKTHAGTLRRVATRSDVSATGLLTVAAAARIDASQVHPRHPGAEVSAKIVCGRRAVGYVWLRQVWEAVQRTLF